MNAREIRPDIFWMGAVDWNRRLFDSLIPLPDGTSYNAYLVRGSEKTALLDAVDPTMWPLLSRQLDNVESLDYIVAHHAEQDHAGSIPRVMERFPEATVICSSKAKPLLIDHLRLDEARVKVVEDGETLSLGNKTLRFIYTPWVHWPETMVTCLQEDRILFSCDFFGSHLATTSLYASTEPYIEEAAKRYFAEIMMPFRNFIRTNMQKVRTCEFDMIAPGHGPIFDKPEVIMGLYDEWISDRMTNKVVLPYISMHGSTALMVDHLTAALVERGIKVELFDLACTDIGKLAMSLVDTATIVIGTPTVHVGPHPLVFYAAHLANALRPKLKYAAIIGSYGWATKAVDQLAALIPNLKAEVLGAVICKGLPLPTTMAELDTLADTIRIRHQEEGLLK